MAPFIHLKRDAAGELHIAGIREVAKLKTTMAGPITPPTSLSTISSPKSSNLGEVTDDSKSVASLWSECINQGDEGMKLLADACEIEQAGQHFDASLLEDFLAIEAFQPAKRGHDDIDDTTEEDAKVVKKARFEVPEDVKADGATKLAVWTPEAESAYEMAQLAVPKINAKWKFKIFGQSLGRNQVIATIVSLAIGSHVDRKVISSHGQTVRDAGERKGYSKQLLDILCIGATDSVLTKEELKRWTLSDELCDLIGVPEGQSAKHWAVPSVLFTDASTGSEMMVPAGLNKTTVRAGQY